MRGNRTVIEELLYTIDADRRVFKVTMYIDHDRPYLSVYYVDAKDDQEAREKVIKYESLLIKPDSVIFCTIELVCALIDKDSVE